MSIRKVTSLTALISFVLEIITSVVLYIVPQGRVAYRSDWHLWGLSKTQWSDLHINLGVLLFLTLVLHAYFNWKRAQLNPSPGGRCRGSIVPHPGCV